MLRAFMHRRLYANLSVVQIINRLRPRQKFEGRKYEKFVRKQIALMQERGVVSRQLKPSDHVLLAKLVYPRPPISLPVPTVPKAERHTALLKMLSRCRQVHRSSPEARHCGPPAGP